MIRNMLIKVSLYFTNTGFIPISPIASLVGGMALLKRFFIRPRFYLFEFLLILFFIYFVISATIYFPLSLTQYGFYRYDGNFIVSYLPIFALAFSKPILNVNNLKRFVVFSTIIHFLWYLYWMVTKTCGFGEMCSFGGFYEARNATGGFLSVLLTISAIYWINGVRKFKYVSIILLIMLISTLSRGSIFGVFVSLLVYFLYIKKGILVDIPLAVLFFAISISIAIYFYNPSFDYSSEGSVVEAFIDESTTSKEANIIIRATYLFPKAIIMFYQSPIVGWGVGSYNDYGSETIEYQTYSSSHAHNSFLHFLAEMGLLGFFLYMCFVFFFRKFWKRNRAKNVLLADVAFFSFLTVFFASFTEHRLTTPASMILVSILIGAFVSYVRYSKYARS